MYAIAKTETPIFNNASFAGSFFDDAWNIKLDPLGLIRSLEMIAFKDTIFFIKKAFEDVQGVLMLEIETSEYRATNPLFINSNFVKLTASRPLERHKNLPPSSLILEQLVSYIGVRYIWGGNCKQGVSGVIKDLPFDKFRHLTSDDLNKITMRGVDCSGLMYEVTEGCVPRNSSWYLNFGKPIECEGLTRDKLCEKLKALDAIIWPGHILFVLNDHMTIEARAQRGYVFVTELHERLEQIEYIEKRRPLNHHLHIDYKNSGYVIRRWHHEIL